MISKVRDLPDLVELFGLAAPLEERLELGRDVEVIFDGVLAATGDQDQVRDARRDGFFDAVLNRRLVDERQHLFRLRLGCGEKPGPESGSGEDSLANRSWHSAIG